MFHRRWEASPDCFGCRLVLRKAYHDTDSFGRDDLPLVPKVADWAHSHILERLAKSKTEDSSI